MTEKPKANTAKQPPQELSDEGLARALDASLQAAASSGATPSASSSDDALTDLGNMLRSRSAAGRVPVVEVRPKRRTRVAAQRPAQARPTEPPVPVRPAALALAPQLLVKGAVERIAGRRGAVRLIARFIAAGRPEAAAAERSAWVEDAAQSLVDDGYDRAAAEMQERALVDEMLVGVMPRREKRP